jgi:hypothetical protein
LAQTDSDDAEPGQHKAANRQADAAHTLPVHRGVAWNQQHQGQSARDMDGAKKGTEGVEGDKICTRCLLCCFAGAGEDDAKLGRVRGGGGGGRGSSISSR